MRMLATGRILCREWTGREIGGEGSRSRMNAGCVYKALQPLTGDGMPQTWLCGCSGEVRRKVWGNY